MATAQKQLQESLKNLGLSEHEAQVYYASLVLGPSTVLKIARVAGLKRTTVYYVIDALERQGLMSVEVRGFKQLYATESPEKLARLVDRRREEFQKLLPEFSALHNLKGGESMIKYYEGLESVKNVYESILRDVRPHENYLVISDTQRWTSLDPKYFLDFRARRAKLNINRRLLLQDTPTAREYQKFQANYRETIKLLPKLTKLVTNLMVIPRRVVIHQLTPPIIAIVIENKSVIQMHQQLFEILWKSLPDQPT